MRRHPRIPGTIRFKRDDLIKALLDHKPHKNKSGKYNPMYKDGNGEQYVRIRVNGMKVKRSHIVWMLYNKKDHIPNDKILHHIDEDKTNNDPRNLKEILGKEHYKNHSILNI